ncbi:unnamed protein product, partial [Gongylonema pulchrum]|uniref:NR LBD domain-containing protein n=1 Tax=Gongylonema pulchrum TaxID=637853 RepID=A0A183EKJ8_9BILA
MSSRLSLDDAYSFLIDSSLVEPITPFRLALYLLIRVVDNYYQQHPIAPQERCLLSAILQRLLQAANLSFLELIEILRISLRPCIPELYTLFLAKVRSHSDDVEILISRDFLQPSRRHERDHSFIFPKGLFGIFIRK